MAKRIIAAIMAVIAIVLISPASFAFAAQKHNSYLEKVLFVDGDYYGSDEKIKERIELLEKACALAIDQAAGRQENDWKYLKEKNVKYLPSFNTIDLKSTDIAGGVGNHRKYTHMGWDYNYPIEKGEKHDPANWSDRKRILYSTVNKVFDFGFFNELFGHACDKNKSFSALLYYVHILGDQIATETHTELDTLVMPLAIPNANETEPDIFYEIKKHCMILFAEQSDSINYSSLMQDLDLLAEEAREYVRNNEIIDTNIKVREYCDYANRLIEDVLENYVPLLLQNEEFFKKAFY